MGCPLEAHGIVGWKEGAPDRLISDQNYHMCCIQRAFIEAYTHNIHRVSVVNLKALFPLRYSSGT